MNEVEEIVVPIKKFAKSRKVAKALIWSGIVAIPVGVYAIAKSQQTSN